jgi:hypothetical protein
MTYRTVKELCDAGAELFSQDSGSTWNDGGRWNTWIYELPDGTFWKVHQPSDYVSSVTALGYKVSQVERVVTELVSFKETQND